VRAASGDREASRSEFQKRSEAAQILNGISDHLLQQLTSESDTASRGNSADAPSSAADYVQIGDEAAGQRIDNYLLRHVKGVPRSRLYRVLRRGEVRVNKGRVRPSYRLRQGDWVRIPPLRSAEPVPPERPRESELRRLAEAILYEDDRLIVVNKPPGLAVHGGSGLSYGVIEVMRFLRPELGTLELVHRLDRDTSGCLMMSKRGSALRELHRLMRARAIGKGYTALLAGRLSQAQAIVEAPLRKNILRSGERVVRVDPAAGKPAQTRFRRLRELGAMTLVEAEPLTGRTHQIRVHAAHLGAPVAGDEKYGDEKANRSLRRSGLKRLFLHAAELSFAPAYSDRPIRVVAPLPQELERVVAALERPHGR
jgi:23S rRNA pseudouridine955/2504/2580 synthase